MMHGSSKAATSRATSCALAGKSARACESCLKRRARWYCASDDAFLCQSCDSSVHLANKLASRHDRVRLDTSSLKTPPSTPNPNFPTTLSPSTLPPPPPPWQGGFTRKARTPRHGPNPSMKKHCPNHYMNNPVVPEIGTDNEGDDHHDLCGDDELIFSVPVFDPLEISSEVDHQNEFCENSTVFGDGMDFDMSLIMGLDDHDKCDDDGEHKWLLPSDAELAEFAADVETLLLDESKGEVTISEEDLVAEESCWGFNFSMKCEPEAVEEKLELEPERCVEGGDGGPKGSEINSKNVFLRLDYEQVISAWASKGSPWISGCRRPEFDCPNFMEGGVGATGVENEMGEAGGGDGGREARVLRYREKRKTRLFSKKIRYQVRKLNAEKRPRLKGRFVKRTNSVVGIHHQLPSCYMMKV